MSKALDSKLLASKISRETNTVISSISTVDKSTNIEPLIILSPNEVLEFEDGLTLLSYDENIRIFVDTVSSDIVYCKPKMSKPGYPTTQPNQTRKPAMAAKEAMDSYSTTANESSSSSCATVRKASVSNPATVNEASVSNPTTVIEANAPVFTTAHNTTKGTSTPLEPMDIIGPLFCHKDKLFPRMLLHQQKNIQNKVILKHSLLQHKQNLMLGKSKPTSLMWIQPTHRIRRIISKRMIIPCFWTCVLAGPPTQAFTSHQARERNSCPILDLQINCVQNKHLAFM